MTDHRNFRSTYLVKVGINKIEEKKSLEILLKEYPLDLMKLRQFCLKFQIPVTYRLHLWKVLLGRNTMFMLLFNSLLLMLAGDINPGPPTTVKKSTPKYLCTVCDRSFRSNIKAVSCDNYELWTHINCCHMD